MASYSLFNFTAMFLMIVGYTCFNIVKNLKLGLKIDDLPLFLPLSIIAFILQGIIWFIPPIFIGSWMQYFIDKCKEKTCDFDFCFTTYGQIEESFKNYLISSLLFFISNLLNCSDIFKLFNVLFQRLCNT